MAPCSFWSECGSHVTLRSKKDTEGVLPSVPFLVGVRRFELRASSLRASLRCPKNASRFRLSSHFSTAAVKPASLFPPPAAGGRFSQTKLRLVRKRPGSHVTLRSKKDTKGVLPSVPFLVGVRRFELRASWSRTKRATSCATPRNSFFIIMTVGANVKRNYCAILRKVHTRPFRRLKRPGFFATGSCISRIVCDKMTKKKQNMTQ